MKIDFLHLQRQYQTYKHKIDSQIQNILSHCHFIMGEEVEELEQQLRSYTSARYCIACSSGTDALILSLMALGIKKDDEIITSPFSFFASSEAIALLGAKPVFVDIDEQTYNLNPSLIEEKITKNTKAILPISLFGQMSDMQRINAIAQIYGLKVIEDASQSFGASYEGHKSCSMSDFATTSFFPSKPLGCYGDGGAVFCQRSEDAEKIKSLLKHGQSKKYFHQYIGLNARLDTMQAGILLAKLPFLDQEIQRRREIASIYSQNLKNCILPFEAKNQKSVFAQYCVRVKDRQKIMAFLNRKGIPTAIHYPLPLHLQEAFKYLGYQKGDFPMSERVSQEIFSLPMDAFLMFEEQEYIIDCFNEGFKQ